MSNGSIASALHCLEQDWKFWIQTSILALSAIGVIVAIYKNGKQARLRGLIDLITQQKADPVLVQATHNVKHLHQKGILLTKFLSQEECQEYKEILLVLNNQEFIAVGVHRGCFDEKTYKLMQCRNVVSLWQASKGFIEEIRRKSQTPTIFQDFEKLAKRWNKRPLKPAK